jgi:hypothetical protein
MAFHVRLSALIVASTFALVGCGGSDGGSDEGVADLSTTKQLAAAKKQLAQEDFVTIEGKGTDKEAGTELEVDLSFAGKTASGSIHFSGLELELLKTNGKAYFKADKKFFESSGAPAQVMEQIGDKWVVIDANDQTFAEMASFVDKKSFTGELLKPDGKVTKGKDKKVNGVDCVALKSSDGTLYLDKKNGRPISIVSSKGEGTLDFSYDKVDAAEAPSSDEVVDLATLGQ